MISLSGTWSITLEAEAGKQSGTICLPGILQGQGYGNAIDRNTPWVSSLHDALWYEQEEYKYAQDRQTNVPFLSQPPRHFLGEAVYERKFKITEASEENWYFFAEAARWKSTVYMDGSYCGEDCSVCAPHQIAVGRLKAGIHTIRVVLDNRMQYKYRPDAHGVSDALGGTWNGMVGELALLTEKEVTERQDQRKAYAEAHPRKIAVEKGRFLVDGKPIYFRGTHFGGEYPLKGYPETEKDWWIEKLRIMKDWGLNGIRFHSYCPPEAAFAAADEEDMYLQVECGMWNVFEPGSDGALMDQVLRKETEKILTYFGHHPSFVFFSPSNEPFGNWYEPLRRWVSESKDFDRKLGYEGRRLYTSQSGWPHEVEPSKVIGSDYLYFHRSGYGPFIGGTIRGPKGWKGGEYTPSLEDVSLPVVCHELGQYCAYPNFDIIDKFTGYLEPSNYRVFYEHAKENGTLPYQKEMVKCSGENQLRLYKEDLEANFRTPALQGFELLDLHDYLGQGTALVGILDAFWESKGYGNPTEFREFCDDTVLLARFPEYVWKNTDNVTVPVEICHYGPETLKDAVLTWNLMKREKDQTVTKIAGMTLPIGQINPGGNTKLEPVSMDFNGITESSVVWFELILEANGRTVRNHWPLTVFVKPEETNYDVIAVRDWEAAKQALTEGKRVVYFPYLSDLDYSCPALSGKTVGWNAQMGPIWCRSLGICVDVKHPVFERFPTDASGGWQWENILNNSRGINLKDMKTLHPMVMPIDDWNRGMLQGLMIEGKAGNGCLLVVAANLEGTFEERPAASVLRHAILSYASSEAFCPTQEIPLNALEKNLFPITRMQELTKKISYSEGVTVKKGENLVTSDPDASVRLEQDDFPISAVITLKKTVKAEGIVYVPEQRDREHAGFAKDYAVEVKTADGSWVRVKSGQMKNSCLSQHILFDQVIETDTIRLTWYSAYGCQEKMSWECRSDGWELVDTPMRAILQIGGIHVICDEQAGHSDVYRTKGEHKSKTIEIEL